MPLSLFLPLRIAIPLFVAVVLSALALVHGYISWSQHMDNLDRNVELQMRSLMSVVQHSINSGYRHGTPERVKADLAQVLLDPYVSIAMVIQGDGKTVASQSSAPAGLTAWKNYMNPATNRAVLRSGVSRVEICGDGHAMCGYFRVNLYESNASYLRGDKGVLFAQYDLSKRKNNESKHIIYFVAGLVVSIFIAAALLWLFLYYLVARRVDDLQYAAQVIADGDFSARSRVEGRDELGRLALEINKMAGFIQQRQAELVENEHRSRLIFDAAADAMFMFGINEDGTPGHFLEVNEYACRQLGYSRDELLEMSVTELNAAETEGNVSAHMQRLKDEGSAVFTTVHRTRDGSRLPVEINAHRLEYQGRPMVLSVARSLSSRKLLEKELHQFKTTLDLTSDRVLMFDDKDYRFIYSNQGAASALGYTAEELLQLHPLQLMTELDREWFDTSLTVLKQGTEKALRFEATLCSKEAGTHPVDVSLQYVKLEAGSGRYIMIARDITGQKMIRHELASANQALRTLSSCNMVLVRSRDEEQLLGDICNAVVNEGGYLLCWIGYAELVDGEKRVTPRASAGGKQDYLQDIRVMWDESDLGSGPIGMAIRTGKAQVVQDVQQDPSFSPWKDSASQRGYRSMIALPLRDETKVIGALGIYSAERNAFTDQEENLLAELADDVSFGIRTLRTSSENIFLQQQHKDAERRLRENLIETIMAMASALEKRDPYTAGHQQRVSLLAAAIAIKMGLPHEQVEGVRFGALIHDIGKIYIPAEILNRPGKLSENEFGLIKSHSRVGYEIIRDVNFPWPVAQMVKQHHERLDGSGYPDGLHGDEILLEAKILAVADVVEAITSHRPYRPSLGVEKALDAITEKRGIWFDTQVVDACVALINDGWSWGEEA